MWNSPGKQRVEISTRRWKKKKKIFKIVLALLFDDIHILVACSIPGHRFINYIR
jgi:hypothetical protein